MIPPILHTEKWTGSEHKVRPSVLLLLWPHFINSLRFTSLYVSRTIRVCLLLYYKFLSLSLPLDFHHCHNTVLMIGFGSQSLGPNLKNSFIVRLIFSSSLSISSSSSSLQFLNTSVIIFRPIRKVRSPFFWDSTRSNSPRILSSASSSHYPSNCPFFQVLSSFKPQIHLLTVIEFFRCSDSTRWDSSRTISSERPDLSLHSQVQSPPFQIFHCHVWRRPDMDGKSSFHSSFSLRQRLCPCSKLPYLSPFPLTTTRKQESNQNIVTLNGVDPDHVERMLKYMYEMDYSAGEGSTVAEQLFLHVHMFKIADMYDIIDLKIASRKKFIFLGRIEWRDRAFADAIEETYKTMEPDPSLRLAIIDICLVNIDALLKRVPFCDVMREYGEFSAQLVHNLAAKKSPNRGPYRNALDFQVGFWTRDSLANARDLKGERLLLISVVLDNVQDLRTGLGPDYPDGIEIGS